ncbi:hypothetical protein CVT26_007823 [Gymnopilus dilepis]|uniref:Protein kinase domain-containing protein n=1 Tax=Gymnopilus dilepis TaxID=231916 RepID=A0A409W886_9AGAR|nr:hypothetical protein CVT26_007823 [Gymnopilus dilepis]
MTSQTRPKVTHLKSTWERLIWAFRLSRFKHPFPKVMEDWHVPMQGDFLSDARNWARIVETWQFIAPYFAARGYTLYQKLPKTGETVPAEKPQAADPALQVYPYARRIAPHRTPGLLMGSTLIWGARDRLGRDVIIKVVSEANNPSNELKVLQRFNEEPLRSHPKNYTIFVLEYLVFHNFVFVVMPRWDMAVGPSFSNIRELMEFTRIILEALDFLHEHRIAHQDLLDQNIGINAFGHDDELFQKNGFRNPDEVQYVLYDFGYSLLFPEDADLASSKVTRYFRYLHGEGPGRSYNPFKADVAMLGYTLEIRVRHIENVVPAIGCFFEKMREEDEGSRPSAREALHQFMQIYNTLSEEQLQTEVTTVFWEPAS